MVARGEASLEDAARERIDQVLLDDALERPGTVGRVVAEVADQLTGRVGELDLDPPLGDTADQVRDLSRIYRRILERYFA